MEPLVEINSEWEFETAIRAGAAVIGINNRNLATLETDLDVSKRLASFFTGSEIAVAASGITGRKEIEAGNRGRNRQFSCGGKHRTGSRHGCVHP